MRYFYKNENSDFYQPKIIENPVFWQVVSLIVFIGTIYAKFKNWSISRLNYIILVSFLVFVGVSIYEFIEAKKYLGNFKRVLSYLVNYADVQRFDTALLNSKTGTGMVTHKYRVLPQTFVYYENKQAHFQVEKVAGWLDADLDKIGEILSSSMGDRWELTSKSVRAQSWFCYTLSPVIQNMRFVPRTINDLRVEPYTLKLMNNLDIHMNELPHVGIFGLTNSRKTTLLLTILLEHIADSDCYFIDGKNEFSVFSSFYPKDRFAVTSLEVMNLFDKVIAIMNERKKKLNAEIAISGRMGLTAYDLRLKPIYVFIDEYASILARFSTPKEKKACSQKLLQLLMQARAYGIYVLYCSQSPSTDVLENQSRSQFGTYILLGSANQDTQRMAFGQVVTSGNVPVGSGYYLEKTAEMTTPQKFQVPDIFTNNLNELSVFEQIYNNRKKN